MVTFEPHEKMENVLRPEPKVIIEWNVPGHREKQYKPGFLEKIWKIGLNLSNF